MFRNAQNQIRIRTDAQPYFALVCWGDAGKVPAHSEHIADDLKMKMRRPSSICGRRADRGYLFPAFYDLAGMQSVQRVFAQMSVQSEKLHSTVVKFVVHDDRGSVIERRGVVC